LVSGLVRFDGHAARFLRALPRFSEGQVKKVAIARASNRAITAPLRVNEAAVLMFKPSLARAPVDDLNRWVPGYPQTFAMPRARTLLSDFKDFINKGNVVDLAIAVVIGGAFGKVVDAVVSLVMGSVLKPALKAANVESLQNWPAGVVLVALINFLVISFVVFLIVRSIEALRRRDEAVAPPDPQAQLAAAATRLAEALDRRQL
jgi:large conductance mechanosensitive channel